jgi:predicted methyltransferase
MRIGISFLLCLILGFPLTSVAASAPGAVDPALARAIASPERSPNFVARDPARHPAEELTFFGLTSTQNVVELWPGAGYWTEILAPYLKAHGQYAVALPRPGDAEEDAVVKRWHERIGPQKDRYGTIHETFLGPGRFAIAPPGSADLILTARNLHNWIEEGYADEALAACFKALKPGGILAVEDHRGRADQPQDPKAKSGYVREDYAVALVKKAGFVLDGASEINANPKDTKDWPKGVWTLPPTLTLGDTDRAKYVAIGESDNFVLKFRKP